jgi:dihydroorotate dehydrogenase electron transfer subunit
MQQALSQHQITLIHGASTAAQLYPDSCQLTAIGHQKVKYIPVTEDGSMGHRGKATDVLPDYSDWADQVYACGPVGMYKAMASSLSPSPLTCSPYDSSRRVGEEKEPVLSLSKDAGEKAMVGEGLVPSRNLKLRQCQVSLEVRMGCGFGACYACTIDTKKGLKQVCRDGPVFELDDIIWQEVRI